MVIELRGVEFHNKGAELMLHAILQKIRSEKPDAIFVMEKGPSAPVEKLKANQIFVKLNYKRYRLPLEKLAVLLPQLIRRRLGYILPMEIDVVFDGSGFAFGDQWGADKAGFRLADHIGKWKAGGKKVIMLPQALGPFTKKDLIDKMKVIISHADLIFARDEISFEFIKALSPGAKNIVLKPDFTNLIKGGVPSYFDVSKYEVAIIPNNKMIETASDADGAAYESLLQNMIELIQQMGHKPYFLIHEGKKDILIAERTNEKLAVKVPVLQEDNPLYVKGIIGASKAVITSRFHGLVSCLSQAVPCLATGWSHKYQMLLKDYGYSEALLDVNCTPVELTEKLQSILNAESRDIIKAKLEKEAYQQKQLSTEMWQLVLEKISN